MHIIRYKELFKADFESLVRLAKALGVTFHPRITDCRNTRQALAAAIMLQINKGIEVRKR